MGGNILFAEFVRDVLGGEIFDGKDSSQRPTEPRKKDMWLRAKQVKAVQAFALRHSANNKMASLLNALVPCGDVGEESAKYFNDQQRLEMSMLELGQLVELCDIAKWELEDVKAAKASAV